jgi:hypothetical protein
MRRTFRPIAVLILILAVVLLEAWALGRIPTYVQRFWDWMTDEAISFFTAVLAVSTIGLWIVTWRGILGQSRDTRIIQRAYLSAKPAGIHTMTDGSVIAHVIFLNSGNLPAKKVRNEVKIGWFDDGNKTDFDEVKITDPGTILLVPNLEVERGTPSLSKQDVAQYRAKRGFVFVWGRIEYEDGFGRPRWRTFCHRYNCSKPTAFRHHDHHNDGN